MTALRRALPTALFLLALGPASARAQFTADKPDEVGLAIAPIEVDRETDRSVAFLLEDYLKANLPRSIRHPVFVGSDLLPALPDGVEGCLQKETCLPLLGGQFNVSLFVVPRLVHAGTELQLECDWYATGNGVKMAREFPRYEAGEERSLLRKLGEHFDLYFPASLKVRAESRAGEGGFVNRDDDVQARRRRQLEEAEERRVSGRREDFGRSRGGDPEVDRDDPMANLRALAGDDDEEPERSTSPDTERQSGRDPSGPDAGDRGRRAARSERTYEVDEGDADGLDEERADRDDRSRVGGAYRGDEPADEGRGGTTVRRADERDRDSATTRRDRELDDAPGDADDEDVVDLGARDRGSSRASAQPRRKASNKEDLDFDEDEADPYELPAGGDTASYAQAQKRGYGTREYKRYLTSGLSFEDYDARRWALGRRFSLRVGGYYGAGSLMRRYASTIYVQAGGTRTDEYWWESLRATFVNPGFGLGVAFAPIDVLSVEVEGSVMYSRATLRREYVSPERGTNIPTEPEVLSRAHGVFDVRARAYVNPRSRVKFAPGLGVTLIVMAPFDFPETDPNYRWSRRPTAAVFGITPVVGMVASLTPFLGLYADLAPTIYLTQGAARAEGHDLFNGVTEPQLPLEAQQEPYAVVPLMGRLSVGVSVNF